MINKNAKLKTIYIYLKTWTFWQSNLCIIKGISMKKYIRERQASGKVVATINKKYVKINNKLQTYSI